MQVTEQKKGQEKKHNKTKTVRLIKTDERFCFMFLTFIISLKVYKISIFSDKSFVFLVTNHRHQIKAQSQIVGKIKAGTGIQHKPTKTSNTIKNIFNNNDKNFFIHHTCF